jgi:SAM-dependent methyltransferase
MTKPGFVVEFGTAGLPPVTDDGRLDAPAFHRNQEAIWTAVEGYLGPVGGHALELGSGTGQHAATYAARTPQLTWWPSDFQASHLASIEAWRHHTGLANLRPPQRIDLADADWRWAGEAPGDKLAAMLCINVLHISPWAVSQNLLRGAARFLGKGGRLIVYGPFMRAGAHTAPSNAAFDASLRAKNTAWGVRDVHDLNRLASDAGLGEAEVTEMPANNLLLAFEADRRN